MTEGVVEKPVKQEEDKESKEDLTAFQIKDRKERTVFVGNLPIDATQKQLKRVFKECGDIEKIWFRSICTEPESKRSERAKILKKEYGSAKDSKNGYVLYMSKKSAGDAKEKFNATKMEDKTLRVDTFLEYKPIPRAQGRTYTATNPAEDFTKTIFIGNLPYVVSEEDVRKQFEDCGKIENVRLIRDPKTFLGKGIGYIMFSTKEEMQKALAEKKGLKFRYRELRINRAVEPKRREKKLKRKAEALEEKRARKAKGNQDSDASEDEQIDKLRNFEKAYESEDSEDEKTKMKKMNLPPVVRLEDTSFGKKKTQSEHNEQYELKLDNMLAFAKRKKQDMLRSMIMTG